MGQGLLQLRHLRNLRFCTTAFWVTSCHPGPACIFQPAMRYLFAALIVALLFAGCADDISQEDKDFYYSGWVKPNRGEEKRMSH
jgi:hypothetical protein